MKSKTLQYFSWVIILTIVTFKSTFAVEELSSEQIRDFKTMAKKYCQLMKLYASSQENAELKIRIQGMFSGENVRISDDLSDLKGSTTIMLADYLGSITKDFKHQLQLEYKIIDEVSVSIIPQLKQKNEKTYAVVELIKHIKNNNSFNRFKDITVKRKLKINIDTKLIEGISGESVANPSDLFLKASQLYAKHKYKEAYKYYQQSADLGYAKAYYALGILDIKGKGCKKNFKRGIKNLCEASKKGNLSASSLLSYFDVLNDSKPYTARRSNLQINPFTYNQTLFGVFTQIKNGSGEDIKMNYYFPFLFPVSRFEFNNFNIGVDLNLYNKTKLVDFTLSLPLKNTAFIVYHPERTDKNLGTKHSVYSFSPSFDVKFKLGDVIEKEEWFFLLAGTSVDYNFYYTRKPGYYQVFSNVFDYPSSTNHDISNVEKYGFNARTGIGYEMKGGKYGNEIITLSLIYTHVLYNWFNTAYEENGVKPYENWKTKIGFLKFKFAYKFGTKY